MTRRAPPAGPAEGISLPNEVETQLRTAARGMLSLARTVSDRRERTQLAYLALAVGGFGEIASGDDRPDHAEVALAPFRELSSAVLDSPFVDRLRRSNSEPIWSDGWTVTGSLNDRVHVSREGVRAFASMNRLDPSPAPEGARVRIRIPALSAGVAPGFVVRRSPVPVPSPWSRIYLNLAAEHAAWCIGHLCDTVATHLPVLAKVSAHPRAYLRRDTGVLYVPSEELPACIEVVQQTLRRDGVVLESGVPLLTRRIGRGLATADEPSDLGTPSHGRWVADLLVHALDRTLGDGPSAGHTNGGEGHGGVASTHPEVQLMGHLVQGILASGRDPTAPHVRGRGPLPLPQPAG